MGQGATTSLLIISVLGTVRIYVVLLVGLGASRWPKEEALLTKETCRCISRVCAQLFLPALVISSTGAALSPGALRDSWQLVVAGVFTIALSAILAGLLGRLLLHPEDRRAFRPVQLAIAFPNCLSFPLLLMESLCEQDGINRDFDDDAGECFTQATGMIFTYFVAWQVCFYGWGFYAMEDANTLELKLTGQPVDSSPSVEAAGVPSSVLPRAMAQAEAWSTGDSKLRIVGKRAVHPVRADLENASIVPLSNQAPHPGANVELGSTSIAPPSVPASHCVANVLVETTSIPPSSVHDSHRVGSGPDTAQGGGDDGHQSGGAQMHAGTVEGSSRLQGCNEIHEDEVDGIQKDVGPTGGPSCLPGGVEATPADQPPQRGNLRAFQDFASKRWQSARELADPAPRRGSLRAYHHYESGRWPSERQMRTASTGPDTVGDGPTAGDDGWVGLFHRFAVVLASPNIISVMIGIFIAMIVQLQEQLFDNPQAILRPLGASIQTLGTPTVAVMILVMAGSLVRTSTVQAGMTVEGGGGGIEWDLRPFRLKAIALHISCRLFLVPAVGFTIYWVAKTYSTVLGDNRLMHLILLIQLAMPSGSLVIVALNQLEMSATAGFMGRLYLWQYVASVFAITIWTALAVHIVY